MDINFWSILLAALASLVVGAVWYHPRVMGKAWQRAAGISDEQIQGSNMLRIFGLTYLLSCLAAFALIFSVVHQFHVYSMLADQPDATKAGTELNNWLLDFMGKYGRNFRTFKHGAFHGTLMGLFFATPLVGINALFERRSWRYIFIHAGYWTITLAIMGGVLCALA